MFVRTLTAAAVLVTALVTTACGGGDSASCDKVVDHTVKLAGMPAPSGDDRKQMIAQCEKQPAKVRECALKAKDLEGLMACK